MGEAGRSDDWPQHITVDYSEESSLNTAQICLPRPADAHGDQKRIWLVYIHGGAWRDPAIDASSFNAAQSLLLENSSLQRIAGIASINYRLSPYPSHQHDPSNPSDPARNARHPDHINDVLKAILYLQEQYRFEDRYLLVGHSCGATLALQVAMKRYWGQQYESTFASELNVVPPVAIVGVEGIYGIAELVEQYAHEPAYLDFIANAFGSDRKLWNEASPLAADFGSSWADGCAVYLLHSISDELVDTKQPELMNSSLLAQGWSVEGPRQVVLRYIDGQKHDEVWQQPAELVKQLAKCVEEIMADL